MSKDLKLLIKHQEKIINKHSQKLNELLEISRKYPECYFKGFYCFSPENKELIKKANCFSINKKYFRTTVNCDFFIRDEELNIDIYLDKVINLYRLTPGRYDYKTQVISQRSVNYIFPFKSKLKKLGFEDHFIEDVISGMFHDIREEKHQMTKDLQKKYHSYMMLL